MSKQTENRTEKKGKYGELIIPGILLLFVLLYWFQARSLALEALIFPIMVSLFLLILVCIQIVRNQKNSEANGVVSEKIHSFNERTKIYKILVIVAVTVFLILTWDLLGAALGLFLIILITMIVLGERRLWVLILVPVVLAIGLTYIFQKILYVPFPSGVLF